MLGPCLSDTVEGLISGWAGPVRTQGDARATVQLAGSASCTVALGVLQPPWGNHHPDHPHHAVMITPTPFNPHRGRPNFGQTERKPNEKYTFPGTRYASATLQAVVELRLNHVEPNREQGSIVMLVAHVQPCPSAIARFVRKSRLTLDRNWAESLFHAKCSVASDNYYRFFSRTMLPLRGTLRGRQSPGKAPHEHKFWRYHFQCSPTRAQTPQWHKLAESLMRGRLLFQSKREAVLPP